MPQSVSADLDFLAMDILVAETTVDDDVVSEDPSIVVVDVVVAVDLLQKHLR